MKVRYVNSKRSRFFYWTLLSLIFLALLSLILVVIFYPRPVATTSKEKPEIKVQTESIGASSIAKKFATSWLEGDVKGANYYTVKGFEIKKSDLNVPKGLKVQYWEVVDTYSSGDGREEVVVECYVKPPKGDTYSLYLSVPVFEKNGEYGVMDYPAMVPAPDRPKAPAEEKMYSGSTVSQSDEQVIKRRLESFFRAYTEGRSNDMQLLFEDQAPKGSLPGVYQGIQEMKAFGKGDNQAIVRVLVKLKVGGVESVQRFEFHMIKSSDWKIRKTTPKI